MKIKVKIILIMLACLNIFSTCSQKPLFEQKAGNLRLAIDKTGKITELEDISKSTNYVAPHEPSYLLGCRKYEADSNTVTLYPESMKIIEQTEAGTKIELAYKEGVKLTVLITPRDNYFRMELTNADPVSEVSMITWGPYKTIMKGLFGEWLGLNRSDDFTIGLLTLDPNTDGNAALHTPYGSLIQLFSYDHTRGRFIGNGNQKLRKSVPIPDLTVIGSSVALFGCPAGKANELGIIEKIEMGEGLPHPIFDGKWNKLSREGQKFCIWAGYTEKDFGDHLSLSKEMTARILCRPGGFFKNWGHFEINPKIYSGGIEAIREDSKKAKKEGIGLTLYSLTTFLKPNPEPEPYVSPVPDERLQTWKAQTRLAKGINKNDKVIAFLNTVDLIETLNAASTRVIRIDNEIIEFKSYSIENNEIIASECQRGAFYTDPADHASQSNVRLMYVAGYHNFYPGTLDLSNEFSDRLNKILVETDLDNFVVDGFESCQETGYGDYTGNIFLKKFYEKCVENKKEVLVTGSGFSAYTWHIVSHISWGEGDQERGFRGTMLDYRLYRQLQLRRNLMPYKLGQYYPDNATAEDIEWLMALMTGWDSGVDFHLNLSNFKNNPEYRKKVEVFQLWEQARDENAFSEHQKMALRQTDAIYKLSHKPDGGWDLKFDRFWQNEKLNILPSSVMNAKPLNGGLESVRPCSIDWSWTHNPGLYDEVGLSDDLIHRTGENETSWEVTFPPYEESKKSWYPTSERNFQFIIRLPENAPCSVGNFRVKVDGQIVDIHYVLEPGQYISIPHTLELACIYNKDHHITGEIYLHGALPKVKKGKTSTVSLSCEPVKSKAKPEVILNARFQNGYFHML